MKASLQVNILSQKCLLGRSGSWQYACMYSNLKAVLVIVVYLYNQKFVASANCSVVLHKILNDILNSTPPADPLHNNKKQIDILISKNQVLQRLYLEHIKLHKLPWIETHDNLIPTKLNNDTVQFHCYITIVNKNIPHN